MNGTELATFCAELNGGATIYANKGTSDWVANKKCWYR
jgi:hypothetical protein